MAEDFGTLNTQILNWGDQAWAKTPRMIAEPRGQRNSLVLKSAFSRSLWLWSDKTLSGMDQDTIRLVGRYRAYSTYPMHDLTEPVHEGIDSEGLAAQKSPTQSARERALHLL
jgi:hypothetical protein